MLMESYDMAKLNARNATAADFDKKAQEHANATWGFAVISGLVAYFVGSYWWVIPALLAAWTMIQSMGSTTYARKLREGTYPIPNPNNGAPDGDAKNW